MEQLNPKKAVKKRISDKEFLEILEKNAGNISQTCRATNRSRSSFYRKVKSSAIFRNTVEEITESLIDRAESALIQKIDDGDLGGICFMLKCKGKARGWVESPRVPGKQKPDPKATEILQSFSDGDFTVVEACIEYEKNGLPVPETLQVLLKKQDLEPPDDDSGYVDIFDEEQLEADARRYNEIRAKIEKEQREFVPARQSEIAEMKEELKDLDSFSDENQGASQ